MLRNFEWDTRKAASNLAAHRVSVEFATAVFADPTLIVLDTTREKDREDRHKAMGMIQGLELFTNRVYHARRRYSNDLGSPR